MMQETGASTIPRWALAALLLTVSMWTACAGVSGPGGQPAAVPLEDGILQLTDELLGQVTDRSGLRRIVAVDLFADADSGQVVRAATRIEAVMLNQAPGRYGPFELVRLAPDLGPVADYLIVGTISPVQGQPSVYRLQGAIKDLKQNRIAGGSSVRVFAADLDDTPMAIFRDNPFYDPPFRKQTLSGESPREAGPPGFENYSLQTLALLRAASSAYDRGEYETALALFRAAESRPDGRTRWTYAGAYLVYEKLGQEAEAEAAFEKVVAISVEKHRMLTVRFLFKVNSVQFWGGEAATRRYDRWIRHIGDYFSRTDHCLTIVGHCSRTGPESWNESLSLMRAKKIQQMLADTLADAATRTRAEGRGSAENVVGTGTDDEKDVLDRRVELHIVECPRS
jgi:outer membrane protein OmpA-like peptidoglycan-associated protein